MLCEIRLVDGGESLTGLTYVDELRVDLLAVDGGLSSHGVGVCVGHKE